MAEQNDGIINGIDTNKIRALVGSIAAEPTSGHLGFEVTSEWRGQTTIVSKVGTLDLRGEKIDRPHEFVIDEPIKMGGKDEALNPQEALFAAINSCVMVGFIVGSSMNGITLEKLEMKTSGSLDFRGIFGLDPAYRPGFSNIQIEVRVKGNGTKEQFDAIVERALARSPNFDSVANPVKLEAKLVLE